VPKTPYLRRTCRLEELLDGFIVARLFGNALIEVEQVAKGIVGVGENVGTLRIRNEGIAVGRPEESYLRALVGTFLEASAQPVSESWKGAPWPDDV